MIKVFRRIRQAGFTLVTALFLLVVVALLSVYMLNFSAVQHTTLAYSLQGARAMQAARAGLEWGVYKAIADAACVALTTFSTNSGDTQFDNFTITVTCTASLHTEGAIAITTFQLTSSASVNTFGSLDYVYRGLQATVSTKPP
ncbi:MAG: pilus assembly protein MshP [Gammaproteobacteria bacterium]|nr:pilus assembly protein MshP [Gammaproteobacteria bacterium]